MSELRKGSHEVVSSFQQSAQMRESIMGEVGDSN
jgi:hypothetical protein